jgi:hypothetical protein
MCRYSHSAGMLSLSLHLKMTILRFSSGQGTKTETIRSLRNVGKIYQTVRCHIATRTSYLFSFEFVEYWISKIENPEGMRQLDRYRNRWKDSERYNTWVWVEPHWCEEAPVRASNEGICYSVQDWRNSSLLKTSRTSHDRSWPNAEI